MFLNMFFYMKYPKYIKIIIEKSIFFKQSEKSDNFHEIIYNLGGRQLEKR